MTNVHARPMRSLRREVFALALMASIPVALALVFPYDALGFRLKQICIKHIHAINLFSSTTIMIMVQKSWFPDLDKS